MITGADRIIVDVSSFTTEQKKALGILFDAVKRNDDALISGISTGITTTTLQLTGTPVTPANGVLYAGDAAWHIIGNPGEPGFLNGWGDFDAPGPTQRSARFRKLSDGIVILKGVISAGVVGLPAFTLPPGYRMGTNTEGFVVSSNSAFGQISISASGDIIPSVGSNIFFFLDLSYYAEQ